jgi:hypothetical protein
MGYLQILISNKMDAVAVAKEVGTILDLLNLFYPIQKQHSH